MPVSIEDSASLMSEINVDLDQISVNMAQVDTARMANGLELPQTLRRKNDPESMIKKQDPSYTEGLAESAFFNSSMNKIIEHMWLGIASSTSDDGSCSVKPTVYLNKQLVPTDRKPDEWVVDTAGKATLSVGCGLVIKPSVAFFEPFTLQTLSRALSQTLVGPDVLNHTNGQREGLDAWKSEVGSASDSQMMAESMYDKHERYSEDLQILDQFDKSLCVGPAHTSHVSITAESIEALVASTAAEAVKEQEECAAREARRPGGSSLRSYTNTDPDRVAIKKAERAAKSRRAINEGLAQTLGRAEGSEADLRSGVNLMSAFNLPISCQEYTQGRQEIASSTLGVTKNSILSGSEVDFQLVDVPGKSYDVFSMV